MRTCYKQAILSQHKMNKTKSLIFPSLLFLLLFFTSCQERSEGKQERETGSTVQEERTVDSESAYVVDVKAVDYAFAIPSEIKSGWVTFKFENMGEMTHVAQILHLKNNISRGESDSILASESYPEIDSVMGGPGMHSAGTSSEITVHLNPGTYLMVCGVNTAEGKSHFDLGMISHITVLDELGTDSPPSPDMTVNLENYHVKTEGELSPGRRTIKIDGSNTQYDVHMLEEEGESTLNAAFDYFRELRDPTSANFLTGVEEGHTSYITLDMTPGAYVWTSHEYGEWGMYERFEITEAGNYRKVVPAEEKSWEVEVTVFNGSILMPDRLEAGLIKFVLDNPAGDEHKIALGRLENDKNFQDYKKFIVKTIKEPQNEDLENPRAGYKVFLEEDAELKVKLKPGRYVVFCDDADSDDQYHISEGELAGFQVY